MQSNRLILAAGAVAAVVAVVALLVFAATLLDDDEPDLPDTSVDVSNGGTPVDVPEFVDAFPPDSPEGEAMDSGSACARDERISWADAETYIDQRVAVLGPVNGIENMEDGSAEITLGTTEDETPVIVILTQTAKRGMPAPPEALFQDEVVCVTGVLSAVGTRITVFVNEPSDIAVL